MIEAKLRIVLPNYVLIILDLIRKITAQLVEHLHLLGHQLIRLVDLAVQTL